MTLSANLGIELTDPNAEQLPTQINEALIDIDAALSQIDIVMTDANYTLSTATDPEEWQYAILHVTGTLTANRNLILPTNKKEYTVVNATTGGFAITPKTSAGTGPSVLNGTTSIVRSDGTNIVEVTTGATAALAAHVAASDPHPVYLTQAEADALYLTQVEADALYAPLTQPFDFTCFYPGVPLSSAYVVRAPIARAVTFPANFAGAYFTATANATATTVFDVQKNGVSIGSVSIAAGTTTATFTTTGGTSKAFAVGDVFGVIAPATPDTTLANPGFVFPGTR